MAGLFGARVQHAFDADVTTFYTYVDQVPWQRIRAPRRPMVRTPGSSPPTHGQAAVWLCRPTALSGDVLKAGRHRTEALVDAIATTAPALGERLRWDG